MVTSPTGKGVIAMGGETENWKNSKAMFELSQSMEWTRLEQTLQIEHYGGLLAIPIPDVYKKVVSKDKENRPSIKNYVVNKFVNHFKLFK